jgi:DNA polymerase III delta prime subunit
MQSFLVIGTDKNETGSYTSGLLKENEINSLDINSYDFEKAMGIGDVRIIQKTILLKPFRGKVKAVIIMAHEGITLEAQNALLKILEEPPANTILIIVVSKKEIVLPTILSRCKIVFLHEEEIKLNDEELSKLNINLNILLNGKIGDKLKTAEIISKDKENLNSWFQKMAFFVKNKSVEENKNSKYFYLLKELQNTFKVIKSTNVSPRIALENLFLTF